jgi:endonuclease YncB( thermonuclease family)
MMRFLLITAFLILSSAPALSSDLFIRDGDSFAMNGKEHRLRGIDAPEYRQYCLKDDQSVPCGKYARQRLENLLTGKELECERITTDRYQRTIARCTVEGEDVAALMVRSGFAFDYPRYSNGAYAEQQKAAKDEDRGLWSMKFEFPWHYKRRK